MSESPDKVPSDEVLSAAPTVYEEPVAPLGLRIVAFLFILLGVLSATDIVLSLVKGSLNLDVGVLGIFIGRGILRRSERWRSCGTSCLGFVFAAMALSLLAYAAVTGYSVLSNTAIDGSLTLPLGAAIAIMIVTFWAFRVLRGPAAKKWCSEPYVPDPTRRRFQFTLRTMLLAMLVCSFVFAKISTDDDLFYMPRQIRDRAGTNRKGSYGVRYIYRDHRFLDKRPRLDCVVFYWTSLGRPSRQGSGMSSHGAQWLIVDGVKVQVSNKHQLHEIVDGKHTTSDQRVTLEELEAYLASKPERCTLQGLLDFVDRRRQKAK